MQAPFRIHCPTQIHFGCDAMATLPGTLPRGATRVLLLHGSSNRAAAPLVAALRQAGLEVATEACTGEPSIASVNALAGTAVAAGPEVVVACGGGSVIDTGKAVAFLLSHDLRLDDPFDRIDPATLERPAAVPLIALPTTAGTGAEVTANAVLDVPTKDAKVSLRGPALAPHHAIVDPALMISAPAGVALASGLDAICQLIESYTSCAATPFSDALTRPAIPAGLRALRHVVEGGTRKDWHDIAWASLSSGMALANSGLGAAHGMASVLGGRYAAPHGALCGRLLVPVLRGNAALAQAGTDTARRIAECIGWIEAAFPSAPDAVPLSGFGTWLEGHALPRLAAFGVADGDLATLADASVCASSSRKNAVPWEAVDFATALRAAL